MFREMLSARLSIHENGIKRAVFVRSKKTVPQSHDAEGIWRTAMKLIRILSIAAFLLLPASSSLFAQNNLPDPNDSACWQSLEALHNCAQVQNDRAMAQAQRCTSYPEYQCEPEAEQPQQTARVARLQKQRTKVDSAATAVQSHQTPGNSSGSDAVVIEMSPAN
jgi:hypothetical protein